MNKKAGLCVQAADSVNKLVICPKIDKEVQNIIKAIGASNGAKLSTEGLQKTTPAPEGSSFKVMLFLNKFSGKTVGTMKLGKTDFTVSGGESPIKMSYKDIN